MAKWNHLSKAKPPFLNYRSAALLMTAVLCLGTLKDVAASELIDYPEDGVELGQGWNSFNVGKAAATCIAFETAESQPGQSKTMQLRAITSEYQLQKSLDIEASVKYKGAAVSIKGKAGFVSNLDMNSSYSNVSAYAVVDDGKFYVAPSTNDHDKRFPSAITLLDRYADIAKSDPERFRRTCGDSFVASISKGGEIVGVLTFKTKSLSRQQEIKSELEGSGWGTTASASMRNKIGSLANDTEMTIRYMQLGGSGDPIATNLDTFYDSITNLPKAVEEKPWFYKISLGRYDDLPNWPQIDRLDQPDYRDMDELAYHYAKWGTLEKDINTILNETSDRLGRTQGYLMGRGVSRDTLLTMEEEVRLKLQYMRRKIDDCQNESAGTDPCQPGDLLAEFRSAQNGQEILVDDYGYRTHLPLPIEGSKTLQRERFLSAEDIKERLFAFWVERTWKARCEISRDDPNICWSRRNLEELKSEIHIDHEIRVNIISTLDNKDHCANINEGHVNYTSPCSLSNENQQFVYSTLHDTFKHVKTGRCLSVKSKSNEKDARIFVSGCNDSSRWEITPGNEAWLLKPKHSGQCLHVRGRTVRTGTQLDQRPCRMLNKREVGWVRQNWILANN